MQAVRDKRSPDGTGVIIDCKQSSIYMIERGSSSTQPADRHQPADRVGQLGVGQEGTLDGGEGVGRREDARDDVAARMGLFNACMATRQAAERRQRV